jgi:hypothetical protein
MQKLRFMKLLNSPYRLIYALAVFVAIISFSCKKEQSLTAQDEDQANLVSTESDAEAEIVFNGIFDDVMGVNNDVGLAGTGIFGRMAPGGNGQTARGDTAPSCTVVSVVHLSSTATFPLKITIDFGSGCLGHDGHLRKGKIITTYSSRLIYPGTTANTEFVNFYIDSIHVEGTHSTTNTVSTGNQYIQKYAIDDNIKLSKPSGNYTEWHSHKDLIQTDGYLTPTYPFDDVFSITGNANGKVKKDNMAVIWNSVITDPLVKKYTCRWISKGKVKIVRQNLPSNSQWIGILDYGNGTCHNTATLTVNGIVHQITLH